jgi:hypothetical protein
MFTEGKSRLLCVKFYTACRHRRASALNLHLEQKYEAGEMVACISQLIVVQLHSPLTNLVIRLA